MKKIINKINLMFTVFILAAGLVKAQLPLQNGDLITSCKYDLLSNNATVAPFKPILMLHRFGNTSAAFMNGKVWTLADSKPAYYSDIKWSYDSLGSIFGIAIDDQKQIYCANSSMYGAGAISSTKKSSIYQIDGATTNPLATVIASGMSTSPKYMTQLTGEFGNLKFIRIGGTGYLFISDMGSKMLVCLKQSSPGSTSWTHNNSFDPKFGTIDNNTMPGQTPYGLAIRKLTGGGYRLYYGRMGKGKGWTEAYNTFYGANKNEVWSIDISSSGSFSGTETKESINLNGSSIDGFVIDNPVSDIAFSSDNQRMLCGQQSITNGASLGPFGSIGAHNSDVYELKEISPHVWDYSTGTGVKYLAGNSSMTSTCSYANGHNAVGGITYSNSILQSQNQQKCDTSIYLTADLIYYGPCGTAPPTQTLNAVYGFQGMQRSGGTQNNSINIDLDDDYGNHDKSRLGDIEAYNAPLECNPCKCGQWLTTPTLNGQPITGVPVKFTTDWTQAKLVVPSGNGDFVGSLQILKNYPIQFVKGNISGLVNAAYQCNGDCPPSYTWTLTTASGATVASGTTLPVDLAIYNSKLDCGKYNLEIKAKCGTSDCGSYNIPITIICEPTNCCTNQIDIDLESSSISAVKNIPNPYAYSTGLFNYIMNFSAPMTEVRVNVEEFKLVANSPNCLNCNNRPVTWGNILAANLNGTAMTLSGNLGVPTGTIAADYREAVYNTGSLLMPSSAGLNIQLSLPAVTELSCCEVSAYVCLKFTFKDSKCKECVQMVCGKFKLVPANNPQWPPYDKAELIKENDIQKFKVLH